MQQWIPSIIYGLCVATSVLCAGLLLRSYRRNSLKLLLWSAICFTLLALNNLTVVVDIFVLPAIDLTVLRATLSVAGVLTLLYGFIWEVN
jgi:hypothetical protein